MYSCNDLLVNVITMFSFLRLIIFMEKAMVDTELTRKL